MFKAAYFALALLAHAQPADDGSALINKALTATGFNFAKSSSGLSFTVDFDNSGSTRRVFVAAAATKVGDSPYHTIYTTAWSGKDQPSEKLVAWAASNVKKMGTFYVFKDSQGTWAIRFGANFDPTELAAEPKSGEVAVTRLKDTIFFVNQVGEEASKEIAKL